ncbi:MAG TPA: TspO/MBR family protein [Planctomycetota bacterium]|nr:TspO/MBR family protein [Planctomycetota bacterium]
MPSRRRDFTLLAGCLLLAFVPATTGFLIRPDAWYFDELKKPAWTPPPWIFGPAWTLLYALQGVALWRVLRAGPFTATFPALMAFGAQWILNALWTPLFFGARRVDLALIDVVLLAAAIAFTIRRFAPFSRAAAWMLAPYLAWTLFAAALNGAIFAMNG